MSKWSPIWKIFSAQVARVGHVRPSLAKLRTEAINIARNDPGTVRPAKPGAKYPAKQPFHRPWGK